MGKKRIEPIRITAALTSLMIILNAAFSPVVAWTIDSQLTTSSAWDTGACVFEDPEGKVWIVWASDMFEFQDDLYYKTSSDGGLSWSSMGLLTADPGEDTMPSVSVLGNGTMLLVWASNRNGNFDLFYKNSSDCGVHWSDATQLTNNASRDNAPSVVQDLDDNVWVFWQRQIAPGQLAIFYRIYDGTMWLDEAPFVLDSYSNANPSVTLTLNGSIWVMWTRLIEGNYDVYYKISNDGGANWLDRPPLVTDTNWDIGPSVHMSKDGTIWVVWASDRPNGALFDLYYKNSSDYGLNWTDDTLLVTSNGDDANPSITSDDEGRVWVAWESTRDDFDIYYKIFYHDVAVTGVWGSVWLKTHGGDVPRTWVFENCMLYINVNITNFGYEIERYFNVTVFYDSITLEERRVDEAVSPGETVTFSGSKYGFEWDTTGLEPGYYVISASSDRVFGEIDISDNFLTGGTIRIRKAGDANGDNKISVLDAIQVMIAFEAYDPYSDFNTDDEVDLYDALILMSAFGT